MDTKLYEPTARGRSSCNAVLGPGGIRTLQGNVRVMQAEVSFLLGLFYVLTPCHYCCIRCICMSLVG